MRDSIFSGVYRRQAKMSMLKLLHFSLTVALFFFAWTLCQPSTVALGRGFYRHAFAVSVAYGVLVFSFSRMYNAYLLGFLSTKRLIFARTISQWFSLGILCLLSAALWGEFSSPIGVLALVAAQFLLDCLWAHAANALCARWNPPRRAILVYRNLRDRKRLGFLERECGARLYKVAEELMYDGGFQGIRHRLDGFDAVFVAGVNSRLRNGILKHCKERDISCFLIPHVGDVIMREAVHIQPFGAPVLHVARTVPSMEYRIAKRLLDIIGSLFGILATSPLMLAVAAAIRLHDGGPALYRQVRLTEGGRTFRILKFRSMRVDAEKDGVARLSTGDTDCRITPVGKWIRKCRLDELPQLFNILWGDMSLVGPRPERPEIAEQYCRALPAFQLRLQVKAGLTGYAQVYGRYNSSPYEKLELDLFYIGNMGLLTDMQLIFATLGVLFLPESTEGVETGAMTAMDTDNEVENTQ